MCVGDILKGIKVFSYGVYFIINFFFINYNIDWLKFWNIKVKDYCEDLYFYFFILYFCLLFFLY